MGGDDRSSGVGSFAPQTVGVTFDIAKETDALAVLRSVHRSAIESDTKNKLRDAIFEYRQNFDQAALTHACELFASVGMSVVGCTSESSSSHAVSSETTKTQAVSRFGSGRRSAFSRSVPAPAVTREHTATASEPATMNVASTPVSINIIHDEPAAAPTPTPEPHKDEPAMTVTFDEPAAPTEEKVSEPVSAPAPVVEPTVSVPPLTQNRPAERINEIKKAVNDRVGNPVNLIDAHNDIGREYMSALLEAMKKSNGGQAEELTTAMARLETAFASVLSVLDTSVVSAPAVPHEEIKAEPAVTVATEPHETEVPTPEPLTPPTPVAEAPASVPVPADTSQSAVSKPIASVAKAKQVEDLMHKQLLEAVERDEIEKQTVEGKLDPIMVSDVTNGLKQLLAEWSLFKSSGLFGTGPSGVEHPLFKKIAGLPMQAVVAGRFEGATPQIRQSISDYMNGWRYEEGVVFDYGESFEHYLRRVIRHILDKKSAGAAKAR